MKAKEFCEKVGKLKPPYILLMELGFSENLAKEFINHYDCHRKVDSTPILRNPIKEIIENYSYSTVEIGEFHFLRFTQTSEKYFRFGCGDGVDMAIRNVDGVIVTMDDDLEIGEIALNSEKFLDALLHSAKLHREFIEDESIYSNPNRNKSFSEKCIQLAGGEDFSNFWDAFCGVL